MSTVEDDVKHEGTHEVKEAEMIQEPELLPPVVTRTRSGRRVRPPAAFIEAEIPTRRTRKSVVQDVPSDSVEAGDKNDIEVCVSPPAEPAPCTDSRETEVCVEPTDTDMSNAGEHHSHATPMETAPQRLDITGKKRTHSESSGTQTPGIPLGKPKSGRVWKDRNKKRFSSMLKDKPLRSSWEKKMEAKREKELVKQYTVQLKEDKARQKEEKRKRREEHLKRRAENERKAEVVQVIRNTAKIKRMKKKHLRRIEKRDTLALLQKSNPKNTKEKEKGGNKGKKEINK